MTVQDIAGNPMVVGPGATGQMIGFTEATPASEVLPLDMYNFLIAPIRRADLNEGNLFVKRYLEGPQAIWAQIQEDIFAARDLWDITRIEDEYLQYLKQIVGWTPDLNSITDELTFDELRKLIAVSVPLWKIRGTEPSYQQFINLIINVRLRIWNWFDLRWVLDETQLGQDHQGRDPWIINFPGPPTNDEMKSNLRIVDDGSLNRALVTEMVKLFRPSGERVQIDYVTFMDLFLDDGDNLQWASDTTDPITVEDRQLKLEDAAFELVYVNVEMFVATQESSLDWINYIAYWRLQGTTTGAGVQFGAVFNYVDEDNYYKVELDVGSNSILLTKRTAGVDGVLATFLVGAVLGEALAESVWYGIRAHIEDVADAGTDLRMRVYWDNEEVFDHVDGAGPHIAGSIGVYHDANATVLLSETELYQLPLEGEYIDIQS